MIEPDTEMVLYFTGNINQMWEPFFNSIKLEFRKIYKPRLNFALKFRPIY